MFMQVACRNQWLRGLERNRATGSRQFLSVTVYNPYFWLVILVVFGAAFWVGAKTHLECRVQPEQAPFELESSVMPDMNEVLVSVWRQALVAGLRFVQIDGEKYPVKTTAKRRLKQVDFQFDGHELRGLEQNPDTKSRWAEMARQGKRVMQFLEGGRYVAVVVDGKMKTYR